ncbi:MAG: DUF3024 domain-containing protein [Thiogranum sp.]|nr:DUF3024 domain-containing protein [Thiogranum sp.]
MSIVSLELQRARQALERFCAMRNPALQGSGRSLCCEQHGDGLILLESRQPEDSMLSPVRVPLVRMNYRDGNWSVYWRVAGDDWAPYPHLPVTDSVQHIVDELEQAPLHVHWG